MEDAAEIREVAAMSEQFHQGIAILEIHPEVCFLGLHEESVNSPKDTRQGQRNRLSAFNKTVMADNDLRRSSIDCLNVPMTESHANIEPVRPVWTMH